MKGKGVRGWAFTFREVDPTDSTEIVEESDAMTTHKCCQIFCTTRRGEEKRPPELNLATFDNILVAHTGLEPVVSALRGQRVSRLHQCASEDWDYRCTAAALAS